MLLYLFFEIFHFFFPYMSLHSKSMGIIIANCHRILRTASARSVDVRECFFCHEFLKPEEDKNRFFFQTSSPKNACMGGCDYSKGPRGAEELLVTLIAVKFTVDSAIRF